MRAYDAATGALTWQQPTTPYPWRGSGSISALAVAGEQVVAAGQPFAAGYGEAAQGRLNSTA